MPGTRETILILDKESHNRWVLTTLLENEKYIVIAVDSIERAVKNISEFEVSGFITEYRIDKDCTVGAIRELKKRFPEAYVMMLTDNDLNEKEYEEVMEAGVDDYFLKPLPSKKILVHLRKGLGRRLVFLQRNRLEKELNRIKTSKNPADTLTIDVDLAPEKSEESATEDTPLPLKEASIRG